MVSGDESGVNEIGHDGAGQDEACEGQERGGAGVTYSSSLIRRYVTG